ncbi:hypothetical protein Ddc_17989 [Ditylenchus destructor]|nr:hypothetical protein Ddc_17989 [Ditylenchus destructor]
MEPQSRERSLPYPSPPPLSPHHFISCLLCVCVNSTATPDSDAPPFHASASQTRPIPKTAPRAALLCLLTVALFISCHRPMKRSPRPLPRLRFSRSEGEPFKSHWASPALQAICSSYSRARDLGRFEAGQVTGIGTPEIPK